MIDFACGTGGMLYEGYDMIKKINKSAEVELFGQDNNDWYAAIALAETIIRGQNPENIKLVDSTLVTDAHENQKMRFILMNPPFGQSWAKDKIGDEQYNKIVEHSTKPSGWYTAGLPQTGDMQLLFWQFALNKLQENGRAAIICNGSPLFSDKANESEIRKWLFEKDYIEAIIQFCPELFYNTGISIYAFIFNKKKSEERKNKIQLINASSFAKRLTKGLGFKRNELTGDHITEIVDLYSKFENNENCKILEKEDFYYKEVPSYQPFQRIFSISEEKILTLYGVQSFKKLYTDEAYYELDEITSKTQAQLDKMDSLLQGKELQEKIIKILRENISATVYKNREDFTNKVIELLPEIRTNKSLVKGIVLAMSEDSDEGMRYYDKKGRVEADPELKDIETIPYKQLISEYYEQEVKPFVDDAWLEEDQNKIRTSCIINFNKFFYKSIEPEASSSILERIKSLSEIESNLENDLYD